MQDTSYDYIKNKYIHKAEILQIDTDSLMYKIKTENVHQEVYKDKELFDFSNYPNDSKCYNDVNNLVIGKMKDETCGVLIKGFVKLKFKMYISVDSRQLWL